jgi:hypothetical protein
MVDMHDGIYTNKITLDHPHRSSSISYFKTEYSILIINILSFIFTSPAFVILYFSPSSKLPTRGAHRSFSPHPSFPYRPPPPTRTPPSFSPEGRSSRRGEAADGAAAAPSSLLTPAGGGPPHLSLSIPNPPNHPPTGEEGEAQRGCSGGGVRSRAEEEGERRAEQGSPASPNAAPATARPCPRARIEPAPAPALLRRDARGELRAPAATGWWSNGAAPISPLPLPQQAATGSRIEEQVRRSSPPRAWRSKAQRRGPLRRLPSRRAGLGALPCSPTTSIAPASTCAGTPSSRASNRELELAGGTLTPADAEGRGDGDADGRQARREIRGDGDAADDDAGASSASISRRAVVGKVDPRFDATARGGPRPPYLKESGAAFILP